MAHALMTAQVRSSCFMAACWHAAFHITTPFRLPTASLLADAFFMLVQACSCCGDYCAGGVDLYRFCRVACGTHAIIALCCGCAGGDNEVQRTMLEIVNQLDGFDARGNVKVCIRT